MEPRFIAAIDKDNVYISIPDYSVEEIAEVLRIREANRIRGLADSLIDPPEE